MRRQTRELARALGVVGLVNVQFAVRDGEVFVIEANPRASRTVPFVAKATGMPLVEAACRVALGDRIADLGLRETTPDGGVGEGGRAAVRAVPRRRRAARARDARDRRGDGHRARLRDRLREGVARRRASRCPGRAATARRPSRSRSTTATSRPPRCWRSGSTTSASASTPPAARRGRSAGSGRRSRRSRRCTRRASATIPDLIRRAATSTWSSTRRSGAAPAATATRSAGPATQAKVPCITTLSGASGGGAGDGAGLEGRPEAAAGAAPGSGGRRARARVTSRVAARRPRHGRGRQLRGDRARRRRRRRPAGHVRDGARSATARRSCRARSGCSGGRTARRRSWSTRRTPSARWRGRATLEVLSPLGRGFDLAGARADDDAAGRRAASARRCSSASRRRSAGRCGSWAGSARRRRRRCST